MKTKYFIGGAGLFCYIAGMSTAFLLISYYQTGEAMELFLLPWLLWTLAAYGLDLVLLKKGISASAYLIFHAVSFAALAILGNLFWMDVKGVTARIFAVIFYGASLVMAEERARAGVRPNQTLVQTESMLMLLGLLLFLEEMGIAPASTARFYVLAAVICSLLALILTRVMSENQVKVGGSRFQGGLLMGTLFSLLVLLGLGFAAAFSEGGRRMLQAFVDWIRRGILFLLGQLERFFTYLISLLPAGEGEDMDLEAPVLPGGAGEEGIVLEGDFSGILLAAGLVLAIAVFLLLVFLLRRLGHMRMRQAGGYGQERQERVIRENKIRQKLWEWMKERKRKLVFCWQCFRYRNTPQGFLLAAEHWGRQHQVVRAQAESPQAYLRRMAAGLEPADERQAGVFLEAAALLEQLFYGKAEPKWTANQVKSWKAALR